MSFDLDAPLSEGEIEAVFARMAEKAIQARAIVATNPLGLETSESFARSASGAECGSFTAGIDGRACGRNTGVASRTHDDAVVRKIEDGLTRNYCCKETNGIGMDLKQLTRKALARKGKPRS